MACPLHTETAALQKCLAEAGQLLRTEAFAPRVARRRVREEAGANTSPGRESALDAGFASGSRLAAVHPWVAGLGCPQVSGISPSRAEGGFCFLGRAGSWRRVQLPHQWPLPGRFQPDPHPWASPTPFSCSLFQLKEGILQQSCSLCRLYLIFVLLCFVLFCFYICFSKGINGLSCRTAWEAM